MLKTLFSIVGCALWFVGGTLAVLAVFGDHPRTMYGELFAVGMLIAAGGVTLLWRSSNEEATSILLLLVVAWGCMGVLLMVFPTSANKTPHQEATLLGVATLPLLVVLRRRWKKRKGQ